MRALVVIRLSRITDTTTSPERQLAECRELCDKRGYEVVGSAEDLDISGAVDPFNIKDRPSLARWLGGEHEPFDVIVAYRVDRLTRSIRHLQKLVAWAEDHGKLIVSATEPHFDMTTPFAAVVIALMGTVAQMELEAIRERTKSAAQHNIKQGKYRGSTPPWGYTPKRDESGTWRLVPDEDQVALIDEVAKRALAGEPLQRIAHDLTKRGVLTPKDQFALSRGREVKHREWSTTQLKRSLLSEAILGYAVSKGRVVRNDDGSPVVRSEPILSREVFDGLVVEIAARSREQRGEPTRATSLLVRVIYCGVCGQPGYKFNGGSHSQYPRYRCRSMTRAVKCGNRTIRMAYADDLVERIILLLLAESERLDRVWDSGSDHSIELAGIDAELVDLTSLLGTGPYRVGTPQRKALDARIEGLATRQAALSVEAPKPAGYTWKPTGEKFGEWWARQDVTAKNVWLRSMNVRLEFDRKGVHLELGDIFALTQQMNAAGSIVGYQELLKAMSESGIQGMTVGPDGEVQLTPNGLTEDQEAAAAEFYGWEV